MVGDAGVGKSSLITSAATESFPEHPPPVLPPTRLAHDTTPEGVPMVLVDTSSRPEDKANLELACRNADVIMLCFDSGNTIGASMPTVLHRELQSIPCFHLALPKALPWLPFACWTYEVITTQ